MLKDIKLIKDKVEYMLETYPHLRDSDARLMSSIWNSECKNSEKITAHDFLKMYASGKLTCAEGIRRSRQLIQQKNPSLRGKSYRGRHKEELKIRSEIKEI